MLVIVLLSSAIAHDGEKMWYTQGKLTHENLESFSSDSYLLIKYVTYISSGSFVCLTIKYCSGVLKIFGCFFSFSGITKTKTLKHCGRPIGPPIHQVLAANWASNPPGA